MDFLPKLRTFPKSSMVLSSKSAIVLMPARFKQLYARTESSNSSMEIFAGPSSTDGSSLSEPTGSTTIPPSPVLTSFFQYERIETTEAKAKELRSLADQMVTLAKRGDLHARRQVLAYLMDESVVKKLFDTIAPKYADRQGGYTRVIKTGLRKGDAAPLAIIELV